MNALCSFDIQIDLNFLCVKMDVKLHLDHTTFAITLKFENQCLIEIYEISKFLISNPSTYEKV
jgi:hypothetical protein